MLHQREACVCSCVQGPGLVLGREERIREAKRRGLSRAMEVDLVADHCYFFDGSPPLRVVPGAANS